MKKRTLQALLVFSVSFVMLSGAASANPFTDDPIEVTESVESVETPMIRIDDLQDEGQANPFSGEIKSLTPRSDGTTDAVYSNGSVATLYSDGSFEGFDISGNRYYFSPGGKITKVTSGGDVKTKESNGDVTQKKADGSKVTKHSDGSTTKQSSGGLVTEYDSNGKVTSYGTSGSSERISSSGGGGTVTGSDGTSLTVNGDGSFSFTDNKGTTYDIKDNGGKMSADISTSRGNWVSADETGITVAPKDSDPVYSDFTEEKAWFVFGNDSFVSLDQFGMGFELLDQGGGNAITVNESGKLEQMFSEGLFNLNATYDSDGSLIEGSFNDERTGEKAEKKTDGSGSFDDGRGHTVDTDPYGNTSVGGFQIREDDDDDTTEETDWSDEPEQLWDNVDWSGEIEPLNIHLALYGIGGGSQFNYGDDSLEQPCAPHNVSVTVNKEGEVEIFLPGFSYEAHEKKYDDYDEGNQSELTMKGRIVKTYLLMNGSEPVYCQEGIIEKATHFSGVYERYGTYLDWDTEDWVPYKEKVENYDLDIYPYGDEHDSISSFTIYYYTSTDSYQVEIFVDGQEHGSNFHAYYDHDNHCLDPSRDTYEPFWEDAGGMSIELFSGDDPGDWRKLEYDYKITNEVHY
ncbi:MAG: hypothetical protein K5673_09265 [Lachnospiraceae bacterium]|nr:hypothetical protein [Lachnospiraceae bacterium]